MFNEISYALILGKPAIMWGGILTLLSFSITAALPLLNEKKIIKTPYSFHPWAARISLLLALVHGALGILAYF